jgi:hypothetical protein
MEELPGGSTPSPAPKRPVLLTVLCSLTFLGSGLNIASGLMIALFIEPFRVVLGNIEKTFDLPGMEILKAATPGFFFSTALFYALSLTGAILMWKLKKAGFHFYTIAQILLILAPMYFLKMPGPSLLDIILSDIFIILYSLHLKIMT